MAEVKRVLARLQEGGWPDPLSWTDRSLLATRAGVALPDEDAMTLKDAAKDLAEAPHLRRDADWSRYDQMFVWYRR